MNKRKINTVYIGGTYSDLTGPHMKARMNRVLLGKFANQSNFSPLRTAIENFIEKHNHGKYREIAKKALNLVGLVFDRQ